MNSKYYFQFLLVAFCCLLASCNEKPNNFFKLFNPKNLSTQEFSFSNGRDTSLITKEGLRIFIQANSFSSSLITIQLKEALTIKEMIEAGLFTMQDNEALSSDGMFNIAIKSGGKFLKPIRIDMPKHSALDAPMKLFKGEEKNGGINWISPEDVTVIKDDALLISGKNIFEKNCSSCHTTSDRPLVGPGLAGVQNIRPKKWLYAFTRNPDCMVHCDPIACCLFNKWGKASMPNCNFNDEQLDSLYAYVEEKAMAAGFGENYKPYSACDSCNFYQNQLFELQMKRDSLINNNGEAVQESGIGTTEFDNGTAPKVEPEKKSAVYYSVSVEAEGWYNVDAMMKDMNTAKPSELTVDLDAPENFTPIVMLVVPSAKSFSKGGKLDNSSSYGFQGTDGKIYLTQNVKAYILAYAEENGKMYFGSQQFNTSLSQNISVTLTGVSKKDMEKTFRSLHIEDIEFSVSKTKNADDIKTIDESLKQLTERSKNCNCGSGLDSLSETSRLESYKYKVKDTSQYRYMSDSSGPCDCGQLEGQSQTPITR